MQFLRYAILSISFLILCQMTSTQGIQVGRCYEDRECGVGFYCSSNLCETCVPCESIFNRQSLMYSSGEPVCAKSVANCGQCFKGFQSIARSDGQFTEKCFPSVQSIPSSTTSTAAPAASVMFLLCFFGRIINQS
ncbi:uncharacterized protein LOC124208071 [Daphnia pulex]|uniref:uncharacterized protein LOC124208071 n=1 Tax=Daphnia pulex TaxID=6669 RepID=UPI001EDFC9D7|nr:uncharacterized protein LOC124208071 [Daphnia pulex]